MGRRLDLQTLLESLNPTGKVYFQPPAGVKMVYPAIVYQRDYREVQHANNLPYIQTKRYQVTVIDRDPDSDIPDKIGQLPLCSYERFFVADNLNHDIFDLYF